MSGVERERSVIAIARPMRRAAAEIDSLFDTLLCGPEDPRGRLYDAMRYATIGGGKRLRPLLVVAAANLFDVPRVRALRAGLAVECVHVHSLIHDDLPCMDDDDLRRGKPTVHVAFDEATAVLAGDSLLAMAFEILADPLTHPSGAVRCDLTLELARAAGAGGMAGGQMLDLMAAETDDDIEAVVRLQRLKTGAIISWCLEAGAILGDASAEERTSLRGYAHCLGLAFQIADDLLDLCGDEATVGKRLNKDVDGGKRTIVALLGERRAREQANLLVQQAIEHLREFRHDRSLLKAIAYFAVGRTY